MIEFGELPLGWLVESIEELCAFNPKHDKKISDDLEVSFVPMAGVDDQTGTIQSHECKLLGEVRKGYTHFADGDVIFAKITPCMENGKSAVARNLSGGLACGSTEFHVLRTYGGVLPDYLHRFLRQESYRQRASGAMTGVVGQRRVPKEFLLDTEIPVPPLNEQRRIVAKIEALMARSQRAKEALEAIPPLLDQFRQSVLAAAFRGDLTADWREQNPDVEPASVLLEKIKKEAPEPKNKKADSALPDPFEIPDEWKWVSLSSICCSITDGDHQAPPKVDKGVPFLVISNISNGKINFSSVRYVTEDYYQAIQKHRKAEKGDLLYSVVGSYGIPVLVDTEDKFCFQRHIALLKPNYSIISKYLLYALKSEFVFRQATEVATGTAQLTVTLSGLRRIRVPLVSLAEQKEIVKRVEILLKIAERVESSWKEIKTYLDQLNQSILAKAFRGELVPQDPNDEPASVLLERIRAERAKREGEAKGAKKSTGKTTERRGRKAKQQDSESIQLGLPGVE